jgi:hypothetical protein
MCARGESAGLCALLLVGTGVSFALLVGAAGMSSVAVVHDDALGAGVHVATHATPAAVARAGASEVRRSRALALGEAQPSSPLPATQTASSGAAATPPTRQQRRRRREDRSQALRGGGRARAAAAAAAAAGSVVDVCFLALGPPKQMDASTTIIRNIEAQSTNSTVRYHLLVDKPVRTLRREMHTRAAWRGVPKRRVELHSLLDVPASAHAAHRRLSRTATGPGAIYLWKPLLHLVLPAAVERVIVLDTDVFVFEDIGGLWAQFDAFGEGELLGVATEQAPSYQEVRALGGLGFNGGVQLLALREMRASAHYAALVETYSARPLRAPMKPGGIGWLGDQTLYSWMSVNGTGARAVFHVLPCGWNRQIGTHMAGWAGFWERHRCPGRCSLLHGNFLSHKRLMESLKADPSGRTCRSTIGKYRGDRDFRKGTADARMLDVIDHTCCRY